MRRRVRKIMAFLLAFALVMSAAGSGKLTVLAETSAQETTAETQSQPASQSTETTASDQSSDTPSESVSEEQPAESEGQTGNDGGGENSGSGESDEQNPPSTGNGSTENSSAPTESVTTPTESVTTPTESTTTPTETGTESESTTEGTNETTSETEETTEDVTEETTEEESETLTEETTEMETETLTEEMTTLEETKTEMVLKEQTLTAEVFENSSYSRSASGTTITLKGVMPEGAKVKAYPVNVQIDDEVVLAAYDITIFDPEGEVYQPQDGAIQVKIENTAVREALQQSEEVSVYHMENESASPEEVSSIQTESNAVVFDANSFSVYVVTTPGDEDEHFTHTYVFYADVDGDGEQEEWKKQILSAGETLNVPETPERSGYIFEGWFGEDDSEFTNFGQEEGTLEENRTTNLYARYTEKIYYVFYKAGNDETSKILATQRYDQVGAVVETEKVQLGTEENKAFLGWSTVQNAEKPDEEIRIPEDGSDLVLYPVIVDVHWITFDSQGGSAVEPVYVRTGETTEEPEEPTYTGYEFDGWYTDSSCENKFEFGSTLQESITLYAKWIPGEVNYRIIYWQENADDDGYSLADSEIRRGTVGTRTNITAEGDKYNGFSLSTDPDRQIVQQQIKNDGTTVVHVYYDRNIYEVKFYKEYAEAGYQYVGKGNGDYNRERYWGGWRYVPVGQGNGSYIYVEAGGRDEITELTITAKYGQDISDMWPSRRTDLGTSYPSQWWTGETNGNNKIYQSGIGEMPLGGDEFYYEEQSGQYTMRTEFYLEGLDGNYHLDHADAFKSDHYKDWETTENDYYGIKGFEVNWKRSAGVGYKAERLGWNTYGWKFYYDRKDYTIQFINEGKLDEEKTFLYEADISNAGYTPTAPAGKEDYTFAGWYTNELLEGDAYVFAGKTMPAGDFPLYAKWVPVSYTVTFDLNGATLEEQEDSAQYDAQVIEKNGIVQKPEDPNREGYTFAGWRRADGTPFNFSTQIVGDMTLFAQWISDAQYTLTYIPGDGSGESVSDSEMYAEGASAKLLSAPESWAPPEEHYGFVCWVDEDGNEYYPGDWYTMPADNVTLTAKWAPVRKTTLTYDFNGGVNEAGYPSITVNIQTPNGEYPIEDQRIHREEYTFAGWTTDKEGKGELLQTGDLIQVDTINPENNVLYAQWVRAVKVTVTKLVTGNMGELDREFGFSYTIYDQKDGKLIETDTFTLSNGESREISDLAKGQYLVITEEAVEGYTTYVNNGDNPSTSFEATIGETDITVTFRNDKTDEVPDTGITDNAGASFMMLLFSVAATLGFTLVVRNRTSRKNRFH